MKTSDMHYLKKAGLGFSACAAILLSSCETPFYIHTQVNPDLSVRRTCYSDSSLIPEQTPPRLRMDFSQPNPVHVKHLETDSLIGFYGESIPVNMKINTDYARIEDAKPFFRSVPPDGNPIIFAMFRNRSLSNERICYIRSTDREGCIGGTGYSDPE